MEISYWGHSCFRIKTKQGVLVTDPYDAATGWKMPAVSADIVTVSHDHHDHNYIRGVSGTTRRKQPFVISEPGEYEVEGISVFGYQTYHDAKEGQERGPNTVYVIQAEDLRVLHLGDLGHKLSDKLVNEVDGVDVLMIPVGGEYTIEAKQAVEIANRVGSSYILPMHYRTNRHDPKTFGKLATLEKFVELDGHPVKKVKTLSLNKVSLPADAVEIVVFE